jgi:hypothetical protein
VERGYRPRGMVITPHASARMFFCYVYNGSAPYLIRTGLLCRTLFVIPVHEV